MTQFDHPGQIVFQRDPHLCLINVSTHMDRVGILVNLSPGDAVIYERTYLFQIAQSLVGDEAEGALCLMDGPIGRDVPAEACTLLHDGTGDFVGSLLAGKP